MDHFEPKEKKPGEDVFGLLLLAATLWLLWESYRIAGFSAIASPGALPMGATAVMLGTIAAVVIRNVRRRPAPATPGESAFTRFRHAALPAAVPGCVALIVLYALAMETLGFLLASFVFLTVSMWSLQRKGLVRALIVSALSLAVIHIIFHYGFDVRLPAGRFF